MSRFEDDVTEEVFVTAFAQGIPDHVSQAAHEKLRLLVAASSLQDVSVVGKILRWRNMSCRYGIPVEGKWHLTFVWDEAFGARSIKLERRRLLDE